MNKKVVILISIIAGVAVMAAGIGLLYNNFKVRKQAKDIYDDANSEYVTVGEDAAESSGDDWWSKADVKLDEAMEDYPDVVAWIYFEDEDISYPVVFAKGDNEKYMKTTYSGTENSAGAIFLDGASDPDLSDPLTLIYGHNMRDGSMFGKLDKYKENRDYYEGHQYFQIHTKNGVYRYQIFACSDVDATDDVYSAIGANPKEFWNVVGSLIDKGNYRTEVAVDASDHVVTLSTCVDDDARRFIVSAVRVGEHS